MSKLSDYSKFDHLDSDIEDDDTENDSSRNDKKNSSIGKQQSQPQIIRPDESPPVVGARMIAHPKNESRSNHIYIFEYNGKKIYSWEQSLEEVIIYIPTPVHVQIQSKEIRCSIQPKHIQVGLIYQPSNCNILNHKLGGTIIPTESTWSLEDNDEDYCYEQQQGGNNKVVIIYLCKSHKGEVWSSALIHDDITTTNTKSNTIDTNNNAPENVVGLDEFSKQQVQKDLMLERFQQENPGMDFRGAQFNGSVPDPRTFMGGVQYQ